MPINVRRNTGLAVERDQRQYTAAPWLGARLGRQPAGIVDVNARALETWI
jgi:hypothetical protein